MVRSAGTKWYYTVQGTRRTIGCGTSCNRRIRRVGRLGGTVEVSTRRRLATPASATSTSFVWLWPPEGLRSSPGEPRERGE